jgi:hypothetical protein
MMANPNSESFTAKYFKSRDFFPIDVNFGDKERIRIVMRPKKGLTEILDIYCNSTHIGMFVSLERTGDMLKIGPGGINKSHAYRYISNFVFVKLLEYYGLTGIKAIVVDLPENPDFSLFLKKLGFIEKNKRFIYELEGEKSNQFFKKLEATNVDILSQVGQIEEILKQNLEPMPPERIVEYRDKIVDKIKNMDPIGKKFWDNRKVAQINVMLSTAVLNNLSLVKHEFIEAMIKTVISSFDTNVRSAYLEELIAALQGKKVFSTPYVQKMVEKVRGVLPEEIKRIHKEHYDAWIAENMLVWKMTDKTDQAATEKTIAESKLKIEDFGMKIKDEMKSMILAIVNHYNGENILYGLPTKLL